MRPSPSPEPTLSSPRACPEPQLTRRNGTRRCVTAIGALALAAALALPASSAAQTASLGQLTYVENEVEQATGNASWRDAVEGSGFDIGERLRTGSGALARIDMPWMALSLSPGSDLSFPDEFVLSLVLEKGRVVLEAEENPVLKLETAEAEIRGTGRAVVRREAGRTLATCLEGSFVVLGGGRAVSLSPGQGTVVAAGRGPTAATETPPPPAGEGLWPGDDPVFTDPGEALELRWVAEAAAFQVEILPAGSDIVLLQRDVGPPPARMAIPWSGAFRWRVASRDDAGLEGVPSSDGLICVDIVE